MKQRKNKLLYVILAIVLILPCFLLSCEVAPDNEMTEVCVDNDHPSGYDYILTEADVNEINAAYAEKHNVKNMNWLASTEEASERRARIYFYFGKYGDTLVIWRNYDSEKRCCFSLEGYEFNFYIGSVWFIKNGKLYYNDDLPVEGLMTAAEAKAFYQDYMVNYLPNLHQDYEVAAFISKIEIPTEDEMAQINDVYDKWIVDKLYNEYISLLSEESQKYVYRSIYNEIGYEPHRFFHKDKFEDYHYYGKIGGKVFLAVETSANYFTSYNSAGYNFVYSGKSPGPLVYVDGVLTEVDEAYQNGIVSEAEIKELHERYLAYYYYFAGGRKEGAIPDELVIREYDETYKSPIELSINEIREIAWEYIEKERNLNSAHGVRCYGKFEGGVYAVMVDGPYMYMQALETERVADYEFYYNNSQKIKIYKDGVFYSMNEAYLMGLISKSDIASIQWEKTVIQD